MRTPAYSVGVAAEVASRDPRHRRWYGWIESHLALKRRFQRLLANALAEFDKGRRKERFADTARLAMRDDVGIISLYWRKHACGTKFDVR